MQYKIFIAFKWRNKQYKKMIKILDSSEVSAAYFRLNQRRAYRAMYSSLWDGYVTDPALMTIPIDDHMVHRGDGVFEAIRVTPTKIFLLQDHIDRLFRSAELTSLNMSWSKDYIKKICLNVAELGKAAANPDNQGIIRLFVSRGPGDFSANPYSTIGSQLYVVFTNFNPPTASQYQNGVTVMFSRVKIKESPFSQIKSCNYLQNVLMKKEAIDNEFDFSVGLTGDEKIAEGPTENILMINNRNELLAPKFDYTLRGTTLLRVLKLAEKLNFSKIENKDISKQDLLCAREVMMVGTTLGVLPVRKIQEQNFTIDFEAQSHKLHKLIMLDMSDSKTS